MKLETYKISVIDKENRQKVIELKANGATHAWYIAKELNPNCEVQVLGFQNF